MGETKRACWVLGKKHGRNRLLGWQNNIKIDLKELGWDNMKVNLHVPYTAGNFPNK
jgi:hypothetical protein